MAYPGELCVPSVLRCQITLWDDTVIGVIILDGHEIGGRATEGHERQIESVLATPMITEEGNVFREDDPRRWFEGLPDQWHGLRLFADFIDGGINMSIAMDYSATGQSTSQLVPKIANDPARVYVLLASNTLNPLQ